MTLNGAIEPVSIIDDYIQTVTFDGGEFRSLAGEFNKLRSITKEQWDMMEQIIRASNKKQKDKSS